MRRVSGLFVLFFVAACRPTAPAQAPAAPPPAADRLVPMGASFALDRHEVTAADYERCVVAGACRDARKDSPVCNAGRAGREKHPVNCVYLTDARDYCRWAGARLPAEGEWRLAAERSGGVFPWGDAAADCTHAHHAPTENQLGCGSEGTSEVGSHPAGRSPDGIDDLAGNVWEWVEVVEGELAVGGGWRSPAAELKAASRRPSAPGSRSNDGGFRCAGPLPR